MFADEFGEFGSSYSDLDELLNLIPPGAAAAFVLIQHLRAIGLKESIRDSGGAMFAHGWITSAALIAMGQEAAEDDLVAAG